MYLLGREQAELTGMRLASLGLKFDKIVHSSMTRATETTNIISKHLPGECRLGTQFVVSNICVVLLRACRTSCLICLSFELLYPNGSIQSM